MEMTWTSSTACRAHDQDTNAFCGQAVEMMILANQGIPIASLDQTVLARRNHANGANPSVTEPGDLLAVLKDLRGHQFAVKERASAKVAMRDIVFGLQTSKVPAAVPIYAF